MARACPPLSGRDCSGRNGGTLTLAPATQGAAFTVKLPALRAVPAVVEPGFPGRRAMVL